MMGSREGMQHWATQERNGRYAGCVSALSFVPSINAFSRHIRSRQRGLCLNRRSFCTTLVYQKRRRSNAVIVSNLTENSDETIKGSFDPVEDGVTLPKVESLDALEAEGEWLQEKLTSWLDQEWEQGEPQPIHKEIGRQTARIYKRQRMEGENDLSSVLIAIGSELEGMDFSASFIGPWNVANKTAEFLIEHKAGPRVKLKPYVTTPDAPKWSEEMESARTENKETDKKASRRPYAPQLVDYFEKLKFLQEVLANDAPKEVLDGAVAVAFGYVYDRERKAWDGREVEDEHFKQFGDNPPDVLGDENDPEFTDTLKYLEMQLGLDEDETGDIAKSLETLIETLHGEDLTVIRTKDPDDHSFHKRMVAVKWLHLCGGF